MIVKPDVAYKICKTIYERNLKGEDVSNIDYVLRKYMYYRCIVKRDPVWNTVYELNRFDSFNIVDKFKDGQR
jgi:hypothetical protein